MQAVEFEGQNFILGRPKGWNEDQCISLPIKRSVHSDPEVPKSQSVWELTDNEIQDIIKSKKIILNILGTIHPPVFMEVLNENNSQTLKTQ